MHGGDGEILDLAQGVERNRRDDEGVPNLERIAVASIYGSGNRGWNMADRFCGMIGADPKVGERSSVCRRELQVFLRSGNLKHLCIRDQEGPLSFTTILVTPSSSSESKINYSICVHFNRYLTHLPLIIGAPIYYTLDQDLNPDNDWIYYLGLLAPIWKEMQRQRHRLIPARQRISSPIDVELFCSVNKRRNHCRKMLEEISVSEQKNMAKLLGIETQNSFRRESGCKKDSLKWRLSIDTPRCLSLIHI